MLNRDFFITHFREEANDHIQEITKKLFQLEEQSGDQKQLIEDILRVAHTLKGSARMMGYQDISALAHKMEDLFVEIRDEHLDLYPTAADLLFYCLDTIAYLVEGMYKNVKRTANIDEIVSLFNDLIAEKNIVVPQVSSPFVKPPSDERVPTAPDQPKTAAPEPVSETKERQYVRIHTWDLDAILNLVGEVLMNQYKYAGQLTSFQEIIQELRDHQHHIAELHNCAQNRENNGSHERLSEISEKLEHSSSEILRRTKALLKQVRTDGQHMHVAMDKLQEYVIGIRMVPASRIFHLFPRLVRMTSKRLGKMVELELLGEDTKIDNRIIEEMRDPLIHLVQNAIRHGIELPEERQIKGKKAIGTITVSAHQEGNRIVIRVKDDGQGINRDRIKAVALEAGMISHRDIQTISDQEVYEFLFQPAFSTADTIDDIAGRGFGLDVVRAHADRVQGEIEVRSQSGQGTEFELKLPLTLTIINALLVQVVDEIFAIPTAAVAKTFDVYPGDIDRAGKMPVVITDDSLLPVVELQKILHFPERLISLDKDTAQTLAGIEDSTRQTVIVIQSEDRRIGFLVDDLVGEREIVLKPLGPCLKRVKNVAGATTFREDVIIILSVRDLVCSAENLLEEIPERPSDDG